LAGMRERVEALGGIFEVKSDIGHGTVLTVNLPVMGGSV
jgi:signal transduction histidine kinase